MADKKDSIKEDLSLSVQLIERKIYLIRKQSNVRFRLSRAL